MLRLSFSRQTLALAHDLGDRAIEAQACYSLGNTYTLLRDYPTAVDYHQRHLSIAQELMDKMGEGKLTALVSSQ
jgi:G-protein signaling modulator 2